MNLYFFLACRRSHLHFVPNGSRRDFLKRRSVRFRGGLWNWNRDPRGRERVKRVAVGRKRRDNMGASVGQCKNKRVILVVLEQVAGAGKGYTGLIGWRPLGEQVAVPAASVSRC